jgi:hypothetical protein
MRKKEEILKDGTRPDLLSLEVLLDIRQLLIEQDKKQEKKSK